MTGHEQDRILLALDACSDLSAGTIDTVATMAARLGAVLEALFVEDADLLRAAELPFVTEVLAAGRERGFTTERLRQVNRDASAALERLMIDAARQRNVHYRFSVAEGNRVRTALAAAQHCDLFMPAHATRRPSSPPHRPIVHDVFRRVAVIYTDSDEASRALEMLRTLARDGLTREVLVFCEGPPPRALLEQLAGERLRTFVQSLTLRPGRETLIEAGRHGAGLLIAPKRALLAAQESISKAQALDTLPLSLLLVR